MAKLRRLANISAWKPRARERAVGLAIISGPLALLLSVLMLAVCAMILTRLPKPVNTYAAITEVTRVQNFGRTALLLWLGGTSDSKPALERRSSAGKDIALNPVPFEVRSIDPADIDRWQGVDAVQWRATYAVTFVAPGSGTAQMSKFAVTIIDRDGDYRLLTWPMIVTDDTHPFTVASKYTVGVDTGSALGRSLSKFAEAYLAPSKGDTSLGQYVSGKWSGSAVANSPYSTAEVLSVKAVAGTANTDSAAPGTQVQVMMRVKASASTQTWSVMDIPLKVTLGKNNVWLVDQIESPVGWGSIEAAEAGEGK